MQAVFAGGGMAWAERYMKDPATAPLCAIDAATPARGSHEGLECRWQDIPSPHGETVSLMVRAVQGTDGLPGPDRESDGDLRQRRALPSGDAAGAVDGAGREAPRQRGRRARRRPGRMGQVALPDAHAAGRGPRLVPDEVRPAHRGDRLEPLPADAGARTATCASSTTSTARSSPVPRRSARRSTAWLEERYARRELVYGLHVTDRAHMTCLVFNYSGKHLHFIDGADGGLFSAAKAFKERAAKLL